MTRSRYNLVHVNDMYCSSRSRHRAFTLIELLVAIALITVLTGMLLPSLGQAKALANRTVCLTNLQGIGVATQFYVNDNDTFPPAWLDSTCRWMDLIKPYAEKTSGLYSCPTDPQRIPCTWDPEIILSYGINTFRFSQNEHCFWYTVQASAVARPASTIIFADCTPGLYYVGGGNNFSEPVNHVDYRHNDGFNAAFCDGHVEWRSKTTKDEWDASQ